MLAKKFKIGRKEIPYILEKGSTENSKYFILKKTPAENDHLQFTCIVSKKIHKKANKRNRIKRRIFEAIRLILKEKPVFISASKTILIPKKSILDCRFSEIKGDLIKTLTKNHNGKI